MRKYLIPFVVIFILPLSSIGQGSSQTKKTIGLTASFPCLNGFVYYDYNTDASGSSAGFGGFGAAFFYKIKDCKFSLNSGYITSHPVPFQPYGSDKDIYETNITAILLEELFHKKMLDKLNLIGGINYTNYKYEFNSHVDTLTSYKRNDNTIGLTVGAEYMLMKNLYMAFLFRPEIVSLDTKQYRHILSLDFRYDINIWKK